MDKIKLGFIRKSKIEMDNETEKCFDILNTPENVNKMIIISDLNKPALCFVIKDLENSLTENFLNNSTNRQNIGRMIKYIMFNYGYKGEKNSIKYFADKYHKVRSDVYYFMSKDIPFDRALEAARTEYYVIFNGKEFSAELLGKRFDWIKMS